MLTKSKRGPFIYMTPYVAYFYLRGLWCPFHFGKRSLRLCISTSLWCMEEAFSWWHRLNVCVCVCCLCAVFMHAVCRKCYIDCLHTVTMTIRWLGPQVAFLKAYPLSVCVCVLASRRRYTAVLNAFSVLWCSWYPINVYSDIVAGLPGAWNWKIPNSV